MVPALPCLILSPKDSSQLSHPLWQFPHETAEISALAPSPLSKFDPGARFQAASKILRDGTSIAFNWDE
jgi:hypothetical protein